MNYEIYDTNDGHPLPFVWAWIKDIPKHPQRETSPDWIYISVDNGRVCSFTFGPDPLHTYVMEMCQVTSDTALKIVHFIRRKFDVQKFEKEEARKMESERLRTEKLGVTSA